MRGVSPSSSMRRVLHHLNLLCLAFLLKPKPLRAGVHNALEIHTVTCFPYTQSAAPAQVHEFRKPHQKPLPAALSPSQRSEVGRVYSSFRPLTCCRSVGLPPALLRITVELANCLSAQHGHTHTHARALTRTYIHIYIYMYACI